MKMRRGISTILVIVMLTLMMTTIPIYGVDYWAIYGEAEAAIAGGQYSLALDKYEMVVDDFVKLGNPVNLALIYGRMGRCRAELSEFDMAEACWNREAEYWSFAGKEQETIAANRKADYVSTTIDLYAKVSSDLAGEDYYHGGKFEPLMGVYIGAYAESDTAVHNVYGKSYMDGFPELTGKKHAAYLLYLTYGMKLSTYKSHFEKARKEGVALQIALQPINGLDEVEDDEYLRNFAKEVSDVDVPIFIRFANEMNDPTSSWFVEPEEYIEKFRIVSSVLHEEASNAIVVWAPNMFPPNTIADYYPGDDYVDWVGISLYKEYLPDLDPLGKNIDRESYVEKLDVIYDLYGDRKPIFISEGGVSYTNYKNGDDISDWAAKQLENLYSYLPMRYPNVKAVFYFDSNHIIENMGIYRNYMLSQNDTMLDMYEEIIDDDYYLSNIGEKAPAFYADIQKYGLAPKSQEISAYVKTPDPDIARVVYEVNGEEIGSSNDLPWSISADFKKYAGQDIVIKVKAYGKNGNLVSQKDIDAYVGSANIEVNGNPLDLNSQAKIIDGRTYLSIRTLVESSGGKIEWDGATSSFVITKGTKELKMSIGSKDILLNGKEQAVSTAPFIFNERSYLPLRYICEEILGYDVDWDGDRLSVLLEI